MSLSKPSLTSLHQNLYYKQAPHKMLIPKAKIPAIMGVMTAIIIEVVTPRQQAGGQQTPMKYQSMCGLQKPNLHSHSVTPTPCIVLLEELCVPKMCEMGHGSMEPYNNRKV